MVMPEEASAGGARKSAGSRIPAELFFKTPLGLDRDLKSRLELGCFMQNMSGNIYEYDPNLHPDR
jgi:hypothetical protein